MANNYKDASRTFKQRMADFDLKIKALIGTNDPFLIVDEAFISISKHGFSQESCDVLIRLSQSEVAKESWRKLFKKKIKDDIGNFYDLAYRIGQSAIVYPLHSSWKKTKTDIQKVGERAADLAHNLRLLIEENRTLRTRRAALIHPAEQAAVSRLVMGVAFSRSGPYLFPPDIESELNEGQARNYPEHRGLTTFQAANLLEDFLSSDESFLRQLTQFEANARKSIDDNPIVPYPGALNADAQLFSVEVCDTIKDFYGSPNTEIVAAFASALFERDIDGETVKKWWRRKRDI